jgi:hypothetical protein
LRASCFSISAVLLAFMSNKETYVLMERLKPERPCKR